MFSAVSVFNFNQLDCHIHLAWLGHNLPQRDT